MKKVLSNRSNNQTKAACVIVVEGCPRSMIDAKLLEEYFLANGWEISKHFKDADVILLGTCGFSESVENKSIKYLSIINKKKKLDAQIVVFGCLPGINPKRLHDEYNVIAITPRTLNKIDDVINAKVKLTQIKDPNILIGCESKKKQFNVFERFLIDRQPSRDFFRRAYLHLLKTNKKGLESYDQNVFNIRIAKGCKGECSYCAIKFAAGPLISKPLDNILEEFNNGLKEGYQVIRLVAGDIGCYGQDLGTNIAVLLENMLNHKRNCTFKITWGDFNPIWLIKFFPELIELISKNIHKFGLMGFPVQSGSEKIIQLMKRGYTVKDAKNCLLALRQTCPDAVLKTHLLIGFPGETENDFCETLNFVKSIKFNEVCIYEYADRPNITSAHLPNRVPSRVKRKRILFLMKELNKEGKCCFAGN